MPKPRMMTIVPSIFFIFQSPKSVPGTTSCCSCAYSFPAFRLTLRISDGGQHITLVLFPKAKVCIKRKMFLVLFSTCFQEEKTLKTSTVSNKQHFAFCFNIVKQGFLNPGVAPCHEKPVRHSGFLKDERFKN